MERPRHSPPQQPGLHESGSAPAALSTDLEPRRTTGSGEVQPADMRVPDDLISRLEECRGLVTTAELRAAGVSRSALRWHLGRTCTLALPGVVAMFTGTL